MTKLLEWLVGIVVYFSIWYTLLNSKGKYELVDRWYTEIYLSPALIIAMLGVYAATVVMWRVFTFNDCPEAAEELQKQILEAKADLRKKGLAL